MDESDNQSINSKPWLWKKGQSGNPNGRPKGKTMKEWAKDYLACMDDDERNSFMEGLPKEVIWKMAEGNPQNDVTSKGEAIIPIPILNNVSSNNSNQEDSILNPEN